MHLVKFIYLNLNKWESIKMLLSELKTLEIDQIMLVSRVLDRFYLLKIVTLNSCLEFDSPRVCSVGEIITLVDPCYDSPPPL